MVLKHQTDLCVPAFSKAIHSDDLSLSKSPLLSPVSPLPSPLSFLPSSLSPLVAQKGHA